MSKNTVLEKIYQKYKRISEKRTLEVDVFLMNDIPVCFSCMEMTIIPDRCVNLFCGLLGIDLNHYSNEMPKIDDKCPLWRGNK